MKAVILAAGAGKRLRPLTDYIPKPLLPAGTSSPVIGEIVKNLKTLEIQEFIVVIGPKGHEIKKYLKRFDIPVSYMTQKKPLGTAHALAAAAEKIDGDVLVTAGDSVYPKSHYKALYSAFIKEDLDAALSLKVLDRRQMIESSTVKMGKDGRILRVMEKPSDEEILSGIACGPLHIFKDIIKDYLKVKKSKRGEYELADSIQMMIDDGLKVKGVVAKKWGHLSSIEDFVRMNFTSVFS
jgi:dTDP-glucose pyrophosphorylase